MKIINKTEIRLENYDKCFVLCDNDSSIGQLYDFSCALQAFFIQKIQETQTKKEEDKIEEISKE